MRNGYTSFNQNDIVKHTYTDVISSEGAAEVEKSPAVETRITVHDQPKYLPAVAHRLARRRLAVRIISS